MDVKVIDRTMDPALKKLLDELPQEDPDRQYATVWTDYTPNHPRVPINQRTNVRLGVWFGPRRESGAVLLRAEVDDGTYGEAWINIDRGFIEAGDYLEVCTTVSLK